MNYTDLYEMYKNGEIDADEFAQLAYGGRLDYDLDQSYEKPRKKKMKKEDF
jgi:hypothetical protein